MTKTEMTKEEKAQAMARRAKKLEEAKQPQKPADEFVQAKEPVPVTASN